MMKNTVAYRCYWNKDFQAVSLPYGSGKVSMYLFVPRKPGLLGSFCRDLAAKTLENWLGEFRTESEIVLLLPRFKVAYSALLNDSLKSLGMEVAFIPGQADFSKMSPARPWIERVIHKAVVDVDERGTIGAAVSVVEMGWGGGPTAFRVDRPFLFLIRDEATGLILFMGAVEDPRG
jgi:serpin B